VTRVVDVEAREGFAIWVRFADGTTGEVDLDELGGPARLRIRVRE